jgi:acyl carrier protein
MTDTHSRLTDIFRDLFDDDDIVIARATTAADIQGWDSLMHIRLILNAEQTFGLKMTAADATALKNVGQLIDLIDARKTR